MKKDLSKSLYLFGLCACLLLIDALIKRWVDLSVHEPIAIWKNFCGIDFYIQHVTNTGGAWGMLASFQKPLLIVRVFLIVALVLYLWRVSPPFKKSLLLSLILTGATGNVIDSFLYGHVIDMFHFIFWGRSYGIFNFADGMIFLGSLGIIFTPKQEIHVKNE